MLLELRLKMLLSLLLKLALLRHSHTLLLLLLLLQVGLPHLGLQCRVLLLSHLVLSKLPLIHGSLLLRIELGRIHGERDLSVSTGKHA